MKIYIGADHAGFKLKQLIVESDIELGGEIEDLGALRIDEYDDYPEYASNVATKVIENSGSMGILICRNGVGMCIVANKYSGIRAVNTSSMDVAVSSRNDDNTNVLCLGSGQLEIDETLSIVKAWIETPFSIEDRHTRRLKMIEDIERSLD